MKKKENTQSFEISSIYSYYIPAQKWVVYFLQAQW